MSEGGGNDRQNLQTRAIFVPLELVRTFVNAYFPMPLVFEVHFASLGGDWGSAMRAVQR